MTGPSTALIGIGPAGSAPISIAAGLLTAAALLSPGRPGRDRWRELTTAAPVPGGPLPALRVVWVIVGSCAVGVVGWAFGGVVSGAVAAGVAALVGTGARRALARHPAESAEGGAELAGCWELLAACLEAGLPVAGAVLATATPLNGGAGRGLRRVAGLLELGGDPVDAWRTVEHRPALAAFARAAARSAGTGAALARVARTEAERLRAALTDTAQARAQRAAVLITGPLGLCFLPAFLVLGIAPVVIGLAGEALARW
jgi:Flp pilus assembly protein TadB